MSLHNHRLSSRFFILWLILSLSPLGATERTGEGFVSIFNGKSLQGWREDPAGEARAWTVKNGVIRGEGKEDRQVYLIYSANENLTDFELKFSYRLVTKGNTGVELRGRSDKTGKRRFEGYHADLGHVGIGSHILGAWDFHFGKDTRKEFACPRGTHLVIDQNGKAKPETIKDAIALSEIRKGDWNSCRIVVRGNHFRFFINGKMASSFHDQFDGRQLEKGFLGLQLHDKGMIVEFKDLFLKEH